MGRRFSSKELYELRNLIPIHVLIEKELAIPAKISEGVFRFLCPLCNEFQTAINPKTNLSVSAGVKMSSDDRFENV